VAEPAVGAVLMAILSHPFGGAKKIFTQLVQPVELRKLGV